MRRFEDTQQEVLRVLNDNAAYREMYLAVISYCETDKEEADVVQACEAARTSKKQIQSAASIVSVLVSCGALKKTILVDDACYKGTLEELQVDESIPEDAEITVILQSTEDGLAAAALKEEELSFANLVAGCPQRIAAFELVLSLCAEPGGKSTQDLQEILGDKGMLEPEDDRDIDGLHASYFTGSLEHIGALAWIDRKWVATSKGQSILQG